MRGKWGNPLLLQTDSIILGSIFHIFSGIFSLLSNDSYHVCCILEVEIDKLFSFTEQVSRFTYNLLCDADDASQVRTCHDYLHTVSAEDKLRNDALERSIHLRRTFPNTQKRKAEQVRCNAFGFGQQRPEARHFARHQSHRSGTSECGEEMHTMRPGLQVDY